MYVINGFLYLLKYMQNISLANFYFCAFKENCIPGISKVFVADLRTFGANKHFTEKCLWFFLFVCFFNQWLDYVSSHINNKIKHYSGSL